jgi:hypothetical protein
MDKRKRIAALAGGGAMAAFIGLSTVTGVFAQTPPATPAAPTAPATNPAQDLLAKVAKNLGIDQARLEAAVKQAQIQAVDEAQQAGRLTAAQAQAAKDRINQNPVGFGPGFGPGGPGGPGREGPGGPRFGGADAATAIGITEDQLRTELQAGKSLAEVAAAHNVSRDQLIQKLVAAETKRIDDAVAAGRLTQDQANQRKANVQTRVTQLVDAKGGPNRP